MKKQIPETVLQALNALKYTKPVCMLHEHDLGDGYFVRVIGDPDEGSYEWCIERPHVTPYTKRPTVENSDCGYGQSEIALRDGLIAFFGPPRQLPAVKSPATPTQRGCEAD